MGKLIVTKPLMNFLGRRNEAAALPVYAPESYGDDDWALAFKGDYGYGVLIGMHVKTKFAFLLKSVHRKEGVDLVRLFGMALDQSLFHIGLTEADVEKLRSDAGEFELVRTQDSTLMGQLNATAGEADEILFEAGENNERLTADELTEALNFRRVKAMGRVTPHEAFEEWLGNYPGIDRGPRLPDDLSSTEGLANVMNVTLDGPVDLRVIDEVFDRYQTRGHGMRSLMESEGFMCAVIASPRMMSPFAMMHGLLGDQEIKWRDENDVRDFLTTVLGWSNHLAQTLGGASGSFSPLFEGLSGKAYKTGVADWCMGFARGWFYKFGEMPNDELAHAVVVILSLAGRTARAQARSVEFDGREYDVAGSSVAPLVQALFKHSQKRADWSEQI